MQLLAQRTRELLDQRRAWHSLPRPFYNDPEIFEADLDLVLSRAWTMVGFEAELTKSGSYISTTIGRTPIVVIKTKAGDIVGLHNSCRHRGAQICPDGSGQTPRLVCPYHQWSYDLDGTLLRASRMGEDFVPAEHNLRKIRLERVAGCIYAAVSEAAPDFSPFRAALEPALAPYRLCDAKLAHVEVLDENANWKLVMENGRECHHCAACHPELKQAFPVNLSDGAAFHNDVRATSFMGRMREVGLDVVPAEGEWWAVARFPLNDGVVSFSIDGKPLVSKRLIQANDGNVGSLRWATEPNNFCHISSDTAVSINVEPVGPQKTKVTAKFLVHKDAVEGVDYNRERLIYLWDQTNRQDRDLAENNQRGVNGLGYVPGPYSPQAEGSVNSFVDWYCGTLRSGFAQSPDA